MKSWELCWLGPNIIWVKLDSWECDWQLGARKCWTWPIQFVQLWERVLCGLA